MDNPMLWAILVPAGLLLAFFGLRYVLLSDLDLEDRLSLYESAEAKLGRDNQRVSPLTQRLDTALEGTSFADTLQRDLARANLRLTVAEFVIIQFGAGILLFIASYGLGAPFPAPFLLPLLAIVAPRFILGYLQGQRLKKFNEQLGDTLLMLANALRSGYSLLQSMDVVARDAPEPTRAEFNRICREVSLGLSNSEAMANAVRRLNSDDFDMVVTAINVQHEVGGNLAQILETISHTIRERVRIKGEIKVLTAQQQLAGYIISFLPVVLGGILYMMNPKYMAGLFTPGIYIMMPICAGIGIVLGFLIMQKITDIEV